jgi:phosphate-selective porin OprO/OprP
VTFLLSVFISSIEAASLASANEDSTFFDEFAEHLKEGKKTESGTHFYWDDGLRIDSSTKKFRLHLNMLLNLDVGRIDTDKELDTAFPNLDGTELDLRRFRLTALGKISDFMKARGQFDFSDGLHVQDLWFSFNEIPYIGDLKIGHFKEPFSLEELTGSQASTFMERALAPWAFAPGRNLGIQIMNAELRKHMTWALGTFADIGDVGDEDDLFDAFDEAAGLNVTSRITGVPWYKDGGAKFVHLGFSYSHQFRDDTDSDARVRFRTRPESRLTDENLVDTGKFFADGVDLIGCEAGLVSGPLSFQAEYIRAMTDSDKERDPEFWGWYFYGSYFLTGERREYVRSRGTFTPETPKHGFRPRRRNWGAWEVALRYSFLDLNDKGIAGGEEQNLTMGLNWYFTQKYRVMFNYVQAEVEDRANPLVDDGSANIFQSRFQISF